MENILTSIHAFLASHKCPASNKDFIYIKFKKYLTQQYPTLKEADYDEAIKTFCEIIGY